MKLQAITKLFLPATALTGAALLLVPVEPAVAFSTLGGSLNYSQRDFRIHNNFSDAVSNNNTTPDANFPGYDGCLVAIWKGAIEWSSELHGGTGFTWECDVQFFAKRGLFDRGWLGSPSAQRERAARLAGW